MRILVIVSDVTSYSGIRGVMTNKMDDVATMAAIMESIVFFRLLPSKAMTVAMYCITIINWHKI